MAKSETYDKALYRYANILSRIALNERPNNKFLAREYNVTQRTIQRDINRLGDKFPIKKDSNGGWMFDYDFCLKGSSYSIDESICLINSLEQTRKAGNGFEEAVEILLKKLILPKFQNPYYIKPPLYEYIDMDSPLMNTIEDAIVYHNVCKIFINKDMHKICPYKIINHDGIWYLLYENIQNEKLEHFVIAKIKKIEPLNEKFIPRNDIQELLQYINSPYYTEHKKFEVLIEVSANIADFFSTRKYLPSQEILEIKKDGTLIIKYTVSHEEEVDNLIKSWLPDIKVVKPSKIANNIKKDLKKYLNIL